MGRWYRWVQCSQQAASSLSAHRELLLLSSTQRVWPQIAEKSFLLRSSSMDLVVSTCEPLLLADQQQPSYLHKHYCRTEQFLWHRHSPRSSSHWLLLLLCCARKWDLVHQIQTQVSHGWQRSFLLLWVMRADVWRTHKLCVFVLSATTYSGISHRLLGITPWPWTPTPTPICHSLWEQMMRSTWTRGSGWSWTLRGWKMALLPW